MTLDKFPRLKELILSIATSNGIINRLEPQDVIETKSMMALSADGIYEPDIQRLEEWLVTLSQEDFETLADGDQVDMQLLITTSPRTTDGEIIINILNDIFEF